MLHLLDNPVYHALCTGDAHLAQGSGEIRYFDASVSPFVGFPLAHASAFETLHGWFPPGRTILHATVVPCTTPAGWRLKAFVKGVQFIFEKKNYEEAPDKTPVALGPEHAAEMVALAALTKPGPFGLRTIEFGGYYGFFEHGRLVAMTGQRLHPGPFTEISAVCTHPDALGKGYATALLQHQLQLICSRGEIPFLHVRHDNERAIAVYERLGFSRRGDMHFYFLERI